MTAQQQTLQPKQQSTAIQKKQQTTPASPLDNFGAYLHARKDKLQKLLPQHMNAERLVTVALAACTKEPKLLNCTIESVYLAVRQAAELGIEVGGALGHGYMVPMGKACTYITGYRGFIMLAKQSGEVEDISARVVHANDKFEVTLGFHEDIVHVPVLKGDPGEVVAAYAVAILPGGKRHLEVMTLAQLNAVKTYSKGGLANSHWEEWCRKTVVRRLIKYLPLSPEKAEKLSRALEIDNDNDGAIDIGGSMDRAEEKAASRTEALMKKVKGLKTVAEQENIQDAELADPAPEPVASEEPPPPTDADAPSADEVAKLEQELAKK